MGFVELHGVVSFYILFAETPCGYLLTVLAG